MKVLREKKEKPRGDETEEKEGEANVADFLMNAPAAGVHTPAADFWGTRRSREREALAAPPPRDRRVKYISTAQNVVETKSVRERRKRGKTTERQRGETEGAEKRKRTREKLAKNTFPCF